MMKINLKSRNTIIFASIFVLITVGVLIAVLFLANKNHRLIMVEHHDGDSILTRNGDNQDVVDGMHLQSEDYISVCDDALLELLLDEDKHVMAEAGTEFEIVASGNDNKGYININIVRGTTLITIENKLSENSEFIVNTPNATLSVRGTTFTTSYDSDKNATVLSVDDGAVNAHFGNENMLVNAGMKVIINENGIVICNRNAARISFGRDYYETDPGNLSADKCDGWFGVSFYSDDDSEEFWCSRLDMTQPNYIYALGLDSNVVTSTDIVYDDYEIIQNIYSDYIVTRDDLCDSYYERLYSDAIDDGVNQYWYTIDATEDFPSTIVVLGCNGVEYTLNVSEVRVSLDAYPDDNHVGHILHIDFNFYEDSVPDIRTLFRIDDLEYVSL